jgi:hypothetical protein
MPRQQESQGIFIHRYTAKWDEAMRPSCPSVGTTVYVSSNPDGRERAAFQRVLEASQRALIGLAYHPAMTWPGDEERDTDVLEVVVDWAAVRKRILADYDVDISRLAVRERAAFDWIETNEEVEHFVTLHGITLYAYFERVSWECDGTYEEDVESLWCRFDDGLRRRSREQQGA